MARFVSGRLPKERMKSFVKLIAIAHLSASAFSAEAVWSVTEERNPLDGGILGVAQVEVDELRIMVRCESAQKWIEARLFSDHDLEAYSQQLTWQFDGTAIRSASWGRSPNGRSLIAPLQVQSEFIRGLRAHRTLELSLQHRAGHMEHVSIPLNGSSAAIGRAVSSCQ